MNFWQRLTYLSPIRQHVTRNELSRVTLAEFTPSKNPICVWIQPALALLGGIFAAGSAFFQRSLLRWLLEHFHRLLSKSCVSKRIHHGVAHDRVFSGLCSPSSHLGGLAVGRLFTLQRAKARLLWLSRQCADSATSPRVLPLRLCWHLNLIKCCQYRVHAWDRIVTCCHWRHAHSRSSAAFRVSPGATKHLHRWGDLIVLRLASPTSSSVHPAGNLEATGQIAVTWRRTAAAVCPESVDFAALPAPSCLAAGSVTAGNLAVGVAVDASLELIAEASSGSASARYRRCRAWRFFTNGGPFPLRKHQLFVEVVHPLACGVNSTLPAIWQFFRKFLLRLFTGWFAIILEVRLELRLVVDSLILLSELM
mmetsp:Transcript_129016/g.241334  ORF Transcript_129016/g.241334 Transcript_129016/m.241334 type:complete len:365 (+) Transcript_129016:316-1410(+)